MSAKRNIKKIAVQKHDEASFIIDRFLDLDEDEVILSIPKAAKFSASESNFKLLKRQAEAAGKKVKIETVDDVALEMAQNVELEASNPFFRRMGNRKVSDIVMDGVKKKSPKKKERKVGKIDLDIKTSHKVRDIDDGESDREEAEFIHELSENFSHDGKEGPAHIFHHHDEDEERNLGLVNLDEDYKKPKAHRKRKRGSFKKWLYSIIFALVIIGVLYLALAVLPKADIVLNTNKEEWTFSDSVVASKSKAEIDLESSLIPAQVFTQKGNRSFQFPANGKQYLEKKAVGTLTIYNAFNSENQALVATTRFKTPAGEVFRIVDNVTVPGAKIEDGKIVPSSIEVEVVADKAGESSNVGAIKKLTIPGFNGSSKFNGFYGELKTGTRGGFVGNAIVATEEDIERALKEARTLMEDSTSALVTAKIPAGFLVLDKASHFSIIKERINEKADKDGMFSVFIDSQLEQLAFKESDLKKLLEEKAVLDMGIEYEVASSELSYESAEANFKQGNLNLEIGYEAKLQKKIDLDDFINNIAGVKEKNLQAVVSQLPGVSKVDISLWPFWVRSVSSKQEKISVEIR